MVCGVEGDLKIALILTVISSPCRNRKKKEMIDISNYKRYVHAIEKYYVLNVRVIMIRFQFYMKILRTKEMLIMMQQSKSTIPQKATPYIYQCSNHSNYSTYHIVSL